jgi:hypothetical protein
MKESFTMATENHRPDQQWTFQFKAKPSDHRDMEHAVSDFKLALNMAFPIVQESQRQRGRYLSGASLIDGCEYSFDVFGLTRLTEGQYHRLLDGFRQIWQSAACADELH